MPLSEDNIIDVKITALEKIMQKGFDDINRRLDDMCKRMVEVGRFDAVEARVVRLEKCNDDLDKRVDQNSFVTKLIGIVSGLLATVVVSVVVALIVGWIK